MSHTNRWSSGYYTLFLSSCRKRCAAVFCCTLLHKLLHLFFMQHGERYLVHAQVGSLRRPRHFLECHVGVWVLLTYNNQETTWINGTDLEQHTAHQHNRGNLAVVCCTKTYISIKLLRELPDVLLKLGGVDLLFLKAVKVQGHQLQSTPTTKKLKCKQGQLIEKVCMSLSI